MLLQFDAGEDGRLQVFVVMRGDCQPGLHGLGQDDCERAGGFEVAASRGDLHGDHVTIAPQPDAGGRLDGRAHLCGGSALFTPVLQ